MPVTFLFSRWTRLNVVARTLLVLVAAVAIGLACGRFAGTHYGAAGVSVLIAVPVAIFLFPRPVLAVLLLLAALGSVFPYGVLPRANLPGHPPINLGDILLALAFFGTLWRRPWPTWPLPMRRFVAGLAVVLALCSLSSVTLAGHGGAGAREAMLGLKNLGYLLLAVTIAVELADRFWWRFLDWAIILAATVSALSIAAAASSSVASFVTHFSSQAVLALAAGGGSTARIRLPGLFFAYAMFIPTVAMVFMVHDRRRPLRIAALALIIAAVAISLNRNMYFGGLIGLVVTTLIGGPRLRFRVAISFAVLIATAALILSSSLAPSGVTTEIGQRATSALSSNVLDSGSAKARALEYHFAFQMIRKHPLKGVGWMQDYGLESGTGQGQRVYVENLYIHLATDYGIPASAAFVLLILGLLVFGAQRALRCHQPRERAMLAAAVGAVLSLALSCLVGTYLQSPDSTASFAGACGLLLAAALRAGEPRELAPEADPGHAAVAAAAA
jgi:O-antigen ligase